MGPLGGKALAKVRHKCLDEFSQKDLHFFLGITQQWHGFAVNPWVIIGVFPIRVEKPAQAVLVKARQTLPRSAHHRFSVRHRPYRARLPR